MRNYNDNFDIHRMPQDEVIAELEKYGIEIIFKPMAIIKNNYSYTETDIYEALQDIKIKISTLKNQKNM